MMPCTARMLRIVLIVASLPVVVWSAGYDSGNVLSNGGFEKGDVSEAANDGMGAYPWLGGNRGGNATAATGRKVRSGAYSLEWSPIGWNVKDDGTDEDVSTFIVVSCGRYTSAGADTVRFTGFVNTSSLESKFSIQVILANGAFTRWNLDTTIPAGGDWKRFDVAMPVSSGDNLLFVAFKALGTSGVGAGDSAVYIDDLTLTFTGKTKTAPKKIVDALPKTPVAVKDRPFYMGFTPFPPDITPEAVERTYKGIAANSDIICHHFDDGVPWPEALEGKPFSKHLTDGWKTRKDKTPADFKVFVAVTPLNAFRKAMALYHGEKDNMPLPKAFENKAFDDPAIMKAYLEYCRRTVKYFKPDYFAVGIEVNELVHNSPEKWPGFVRLYKHVYSRLKKDYPQMPIFCTFTLHNMLQDGWSDIELQREKVREFLPEVDIAGISFYPFMKTLGAPERPFEAFDWIRKFVGDKPIAITETGFPAEPTHLKDFNVTLPGGEQGQAAYIESVLSAAGRDRYLFVIAFLYQDYDALWEKIKGSFSGDWAAAWRDCGLLDGDGKKRPAHEVWEKYARAKYLPK